MAGAAEHENQQSRQRLHGRFLLDLASKPTIMFLVLWIESVQLLLLHLSAT